MQLLSCTLLHTVACLPMAKIQLHAWRDAFDYLKSPCFKLGLDVSLYSRLSIWPSIGVTPSHLQSLIQCQPAQPKRMGSRPSLDCTHQQLLSQTPSRDACPKPSS